MVRLSQLPDKCRFGDSVAHRSQHQLGLVLTYIIAKGDAAKLCSYNDPEWLFPLDRTGSWHWLVTVWPWASCSVSLSFTSLICKWNGASLAEILESQMYWNLWKVSYTFRNECLFVSSYFFSFYFSLQHLSVLGYNWIVKEIDRKFHITKTSKHVTAKILKENL